MNSVRPTLRSNGSPMQADAGRRSFIRKTGAALSAVLASAVSGISKPRAGENETMKDQVDRLTNELGILEDANAIRKLHQAYEYHLDKSMYEEVINLFASDGEVYFNGGIFMGKSQGVRRLYLDHFKQGSTGRKIERAPDSQRDAAQQQEIVEVAPDRKSARARFPYSMQVGIRDTSEYPMMDLARKQGQGIIQWWEGGVYENSYVKDGDSWKIRRLDYRVLWQANYAPGLSYTMPISVPLFSKPYPENPTGPDKLISTTQELRKALPEDT